MSDGPDQSVQEQSAHSSNSFRSYVVADDFTGVCDTGIVFRLAGQRVVAQLDSDAKWQEPAGAGVTQVKLTDTRKYGVEEGRRRVAAAVRGLRASDGRVCLYQKVDSTMRGHVGAELDTVLSIIGRHVAVVCPAYPAVGRTVRGGDLFVDGAAITQTAYARDPRDPIRTDSIAGMIGETADVQVMSTSPAGLEDAVTGAASRDGRVAIAVDASTDEDLAVIAGVVADHPEVLPVGSAGMARQLAGRWSAGSGAQTDRRPPEADQIIVACGSANPASLRQLEVLEASGVPLQKVSVNPRALIDEQEATAEIENARRDVASKIGHGAVLEISLADDRMTEPPYRDTFESFVAELVGEAIAAGRTPPNRTAVVVAGADTCVSICHRLGVATLSPQGEILPGIPWSTTNNRYTFVSKAGGFGASDALLRCVQYLKTAAEHISRGEKKA